MRHLEDAEQIALFQWAAMQSAKFPELQLMFHIPNGGKRNAQEAARFKLMGVKAGVPDLFLPVARGGFHGLWIELKSPKGKTSASQETFLKELCNQGYKTAVCFGWEMAAKVLKEYIEQAKTMRVSGT